MNKLPSKNLNSGELLEELQLYKKYTRQKVQQALGPQDEFKTSSGKWSPSGIIRDRPSQGDTVLFVTLGHNSGNDYDDSVTQDGILKWLSQNRNTPSSPLIQQLVSHDSEKNVVSLFLRTSRSDEYTYMGPLAFLDWNPSSSKPVHITWKIINWPLPMNLPESIGLNLDLPISPTYDASIRNLSVATLKETSFPKTTAPKKPGLTNNKSGSVDWAKIEQRNRELGLLGEKAVIEHEKKQLLEHGRPELADSIQHTALVNTAAGYDIKSFDPITGLEKYIEVKTTTGNKNTPFFISPNEINISIAKDKQYWVYRLYNFRSTSEVEFYKVTGDMSSALHLTPDSYKATPK